MMEAARSSEMLVSYDNNTWHHNADLTLNIFVTTLNEIIKTLKKPTCVQQK